MLRQLQPAAATSLSLFPFLLPCACDCTSHRLPLPLPLPLFLPLLQPHCLVPCILLREFFSLVSISRCFLLLFFLFSLPFSLETCAQTFKSIVPQTTLPEGACRSQCNCYAKCEHAPKSSSKCAQIDTAQTLSSLPPSLLFPLPTISGNTQDKVAKKETEADNLIIELTKLVQNLCKRLPKDNSKLYLLSCKCELKEAQIRKSYQIIQI